MKFIGYFFLFVALTILFVPVTANVIHYFHSSDPHFLKSFFSSIVFGPLLALFTTAFIAQKISKLNGTKKSETAPTATPSPPLEASYTADIMKVINKKIPWRNKET